MKITVLDDYQNVVRSLDAMKKVEGHDVTIWNDHTKDTDVLAERLKDTEALVLIRERTPIRAPLIERLSKLRIVSQRSVYPHVDVDALTKKGILLCSDMHPGKPSYATAELTWGLVIAAMRRIPQEMARLKAGHWQSTVGTGLRGRTLGILGYGRIGGAVAGYGRAFGMKVIAWGREGSLQRARADGYAVAPSRETFF
jgi:D-3-phosphoglycerate dehydrogenase